MAESEPAAETAATRPTPRRAALAALAAELGHDLQGPLNVFRLATDRLATGQALDSEDVGLLAEELARLSELSARLREVARLPLRPVRCSASSVLHWALTQASVPTAALEVEQGGAVELECDPELLGLALAALIDNALVARAARAGLRLGWPARPGFCVWDDGPGFPGGTERAFDWGVTSQPGGAGLGLSLALRVARAHGFDLAVERGDGHTEVWLDVPSEHGAKT